MQPDTEELKRNYAGFSDQKLIKIATEQAAGLRPEALEILQAELRKRRLSEDLQKGIEVQFKEADQQEVEEYCAVIRSLPCPQCHSMAARLNATVTGHVASFGLFTSYNKQLKVACPDCLDQANHTAMLTTGLLGWWGIPWGVIRTIQSLHLNYQMKKHNRLDTPSPALQEMVRANMGRIAAFRNDKNQLREFIGRI